MTTTLPRNQASRPFGWFRGWSTGGLLLSGCMAILPACTVFAVGTELEFFERKIRPLLTERCVSCHGEEKQKGHLRLDSPEGIRAGGDGGSVIEGGAPEKSRLIRAVRYADEDLKMPPKQRLSDAEIADLVRWVSQGAALPTNAVASAAGSPRREFQIGDRERSHWAFQAVKRPPVPQHGGVSPNPIDAFIAAGLQAQSLTPNGPATRRELIRRAYFDLTGLPPSPADVERFLADPSPDAWEALIDRLLASPHYGEKWGRHWLDLVRFAESNSYERDGAKPQAWRYRDYVIRSLNADKPYDRFLREQLAGDELPNADADAIIATGFYRLGIWDDEPVDRELARYDGLDDIVTTAGQTFLGLTVDCARCHHHKIDPISQHDYYRLVSFFQNINHFRNGGPTDEVPIFPDAAARDTYLVKTRERDALLKQLAQELESAETRFKTRYEETQGGTGTPAKRDWPALLKAKGAELLGPEAWAQLTQTRERLEKLRQTPTPVEQALAVTEAGTNAPETFVLLRGNPNLKGDKVEPGFLQVLSTNVAAPPAVPVGGKTSGRRTLLADWMTSTANPLTARVMVNRLWQHHFGRGIVRSPNNFGIQGDRPTHPELLDWLASEFMAQGWHLKAMHRLIMTSQVYQRASAGRAEALAKDPMNQLFWRFDMRRLTAEEIRDSLLAITGTLNPRMYGPGVYVDIPKEVLAGQSQPGSGWGKSTADEQARRSVYIHVKRSLITPILESFDVAETDRSAPVRFATVQPTQALGMLNGAFLNQQAALLKDRLQREFKSDPARQVQQALYLATGRAPSEGEVRRGQELIRSLIERDQASPDTALRYFCLLVLNLNEMIYLD